MLQMQRITRRTLAPLPLLLLIVVALLSLAYASETAHRYVKDESVIVWVNRVGPFKNPQEYYFYYSLPFCPPDHHQSQAEGLGEAIQGYELTRANLDIAFRYDIQPKLICEKTLTAQEAAVFHRAVDERYWYQLFIDDLPVWGLVGDIVEGPDDKREHYVYTHQQFDIAYNNDRIIEVNLTADNAVPIRENAKLSFTFGVNWVETTVSFEERFDKYLDNDFFEHEIHWFSVLNSFMLVVFLVGVVAMILLRTLRKDYAKFAADDDLEEDIVEESGWKQIHADVFRAPTRLVLFSALLGTAHQLMSLVFMVLAFAILGSYYRNRGTVVSASIICYMLTAVVAGYSSGGYYMRREGKSWIKTMFVTATLFPTTIGVSAFVLNFGAKYYDAQSFIPFGTMMILLALWIFISVPLTVVGTIFGRHWNGAPDVPCRISLVPRHLPDKPWYMSPTIVACAGGLLPFASIFIEIYFLFTSFWHYKYYYVYGFLLMTYVILLLVTSCVTIVTVYFTLNTEDYRWQWMAFFSGSSTAVYVYLYSIYYYYTRTQMSGFLQTSFYFGYVGMFCLGLGILCGGVAFSATSTFVKRIYRNVKVD